MSKSKKRKKRGSLLDKLGKGCPRPIDSTAMRVLGFSNFKNSSKPRMGQNAVKRAERALERAKWERENPKR